MKPDANYICKLCGKTFEREEEFTYGHYKRKETTVFCGGGGKAA